MNHGQRTRNGGGKIPGCEVHCTAFRAVASAGTNLLVLLGALTLGGCGSEDSSDRGQRNDNPALEHRLLNGGGKFTLDWRAPFLGATYEDPVRIDSQDSAIEVFELVRNDDTEFAHPKRIWIYRPVGEHKPESLYAVLVPVAGDGLLSGRPLRKEDHAKHYPYARAGFLVAAFETGSVLAEAKEPTTEERRNALDGLMRMRAGIDNVLTATQCLQKEFPEGVLGKYLIVGDGSSGALSLLTAAHDPRILGCAALSPVTDLPEYLGSQIEALKEDVPRISEFAEEASPLRHVGKVKCPVFLFHAEDDPQVPCAKTIEFAVDLSEHGASVTFEMPVSGGHDEAIIEEGIPKAVEWLVALREELPVPPAFQAQHAAERHAERVAEREKLDADRAAKLEAHFAEMSAKEAERKAARAAREKERQRQEALARQVPKVWNIEPDPAARLPKIPADLRIPFPSQIGGDVLFPTLPGPAVALGRNGEGERASWDLEESRQIGSIRGKIPTSVHGEALSPDGRFLAVCPRRQEVALGQRIDVWSFDDGSHTTVSSGEGKSVWVTFMAFRSVDELVVMRESHVEQLRIPDGKVLQDFRISGTTGTKPALTMSPGGRYLAVFGQYLAIYDLRDGSLAGATPLPGHTEIARCRPIDIAFSLDGRGIAAIYDENEQANLACWRADNGQVIAHHQAAKEWGYLVSGLSSDENALQWLGDKRGWLLGGYVMVNRDNFQERWRLPRPSNATCLIDGQNLLWSLDVGFEEYLVCDPVSLDQCFDAELRKKQEGPNNPFPDMALAGLVRFKIEGYPATGDATAIAKTVFEAIGWADSNAVRVDRERDELIVGVRIMMLNTGPAKQGLERAGFRLGPTMVSPL